MRGRGRRKGRKGGGGEIRETNNVLLVRKGEGEREGQKR